MKAHNKQKLLNRLDAALQDLYHNATPHHPTLNLDSSLYEAYDSWFNFAAEMEVEYISDGLGRGKEEYARAKARGLWKGNERHYYLVQRITDYGKLYTYGRGGRTLAPSELVRLRGGSGFSLKSSSDFEGASKLHIIELIETVEAFNHYVNEWCSEANLLEIWKDEALTRASDNREAASSILKECKALTAGIKESRVASVVCNVLIEKLKSLKHNHSELMKEAYFYNQSIRG